MVSHKRETRTLNDKDKLPTNPDPSSPRSNNSNSASIMPPLPSFHSLNSSSLAINHNTNASSISRKMCHSNEISNSSVLRNTPTIQHSTSSISTSSNVCSLLHNSNRHHRIPHLPTTTTLRLFCNKSWTS